LKKKKQTEWRRGGRSKRKGECPKNAFVEQGVKTKIEERQKKRLE